MAQIPVPMSGTYTIDQNAAAGNGNYQSFSTFADDINSLGVIGAVTVNVAQGTYNESLELGDIIGATSVNNIVIQADPANTQPVILRNTTSSISGGTIKYTGTKFVTIDGLTITADLSMSYTRLVYMVSGTMNDLVFKNCEFIGKDVTSTSSYYCIFYEGSAYIQGSGLTIENCTSTGGSDFAYIYGSSGTNFNTNLTITDCTVEDNYGDFLYLGYFKNITLLDNVWTPKAMTTTQYVMRAYTTTSAGNSGGRLDIQRNYFDVECSSSFYGFYLYYYGASAADPSIIANNFIQNRSTSSTSALRYVFYTFGMGNADIVHNTIRVNDGSATSNRTMYFTTGSPTDYTPGNINFQNNIISNYSTGNGGTAFYATGNATTYFTNISNNIYDTPNSTRPFYFGTYYTTHAGFAGASGDVNSMVGDPQYLGAFDYRVEGFLPSDNGINLPSVQEDIEGDARPLPAATNVDIGCDEFIPPTCPAPVALSFATGDTTTATFSWNSVNASEWELEYGPSGFTPGTGTIAYVNSMPGTITGLTAYQTYDVYIRSICGAGDTSRQVGPSGFNTYGQGIYMDYDQNCISFIDISTSPTVTDLNLFNNGEAGITLPFPWLVQGELVNEITVGHEGGVLFNTLNGQVYTTMGSGRGFYPYVQNLDNDIQGVNQVGVLTDVVGIAPNRKFVVMWKNRTHVSGFSNPNPVTFELVYDESTTDVYYLYSDVDAGNPNYDNGADAEIGVRGFNQDIDISINNSSYLTQNSCAHLYYTNCPRPQNFILAYVTLDEAGIQWSPGLSNETSWHIVYGPSGFDPATSGVSTTEFNTVALLPNLIHNTDYDVYISALCAGGDTSLALVGSFRTDSRCGQPYDLDGFTSVDSLMGDWLWSSNHAATYPLTGFNFFYGDHEFDPATEGNVRVLDSVFGDTVVDPGFRPGGVYDIYIQSLCDQESSDTIGPVTVVMPLTNNTPCGAYDLPVDDVSRIFSNEDASVMQNEDGLAPDVTGERRRDGWAHNELTHTAWYTFKAPASGNVRINSTDREYNGQIAVYEVGNCQVFSSYFLLGANDDEINGTSLAPNFTLCGLDPGSEYFLMFDSYEVDEPGIYNMRLTEVFLDAGSPISADTFNLCTRDTFNLFNGLSNYQAGGVWLDTDNSNRIIQDSLFNTNGLPYEAYTFEYRIEEGCAFDSVLVEFRVHPNNFAGEDGFRDVCKNEPINLLGSLGDLVDHGGTWFDPNGNQMASGEILTGEFDTQGTYVYMYVVDNGVCEPDTSYVTVNVDVTCDYTGIGENNLGSMKVYPNPTSTASVVEWEGAKVEMINLVDMNGRVITTIIPEAGQESAQLNMVTVESGMYWVRMTTESGVAQLKVVKQ